MANKLQSTRLNRKFGKAFSRLEDWTLNPWRKYSLFLIVFLSSFLIGSSIGLINGVLALMDPLGALFSVFVLEVMVRIRRYWKGSNRLPIAVQLMDIARIGLLYGLLMEGFKLF